MCGIIAIINQNREPLTEDDIMRFKEMLIRCQSRGTHATGIFNDRLVYVKQNMRATEFLEQPEVIAYLDDQIGKAIYLVGHTRMATQGSPDKNTNNHPLNGGEFLLVHNGIVHDGKKALQYKAQNKTDTYLLVDAINHRLGKQRKIKAITNGLDSVGGSVVAFVGFYDRLTLYVRDNPLVYEVNNDTVYYASTAHILGAPIHVLFPDNHYLTWPLRMRKHKTEPVQITVPKKAITYYNDYTMNEFYWQTEPLDEFVQIGPDTWALVPTAEAKVLRKKEKKKKKKNKKNKKNKGIKYQTARDRYTWDKFNWGDKHETK